MCPCMVISILEGSGGSNGTEWGGEGGHGSSNSKKL